MPLPLSVLLRFTIKTVLKINSPRWRRRRRKNNFSFLFRPVARLMVFIDFRCTAAMVYRPLHDAYTHTPTQTDRPVAHTILYIKRREERSSVRPTAQLIDSFSAVRPNNIRQPANRSSPNSLPPTSFQRILSAVHTHTHTH